MIDTPKRNDATKRNAPRRAGERRARAATGRRRPREDYGATLPLAAEELTVVKQKRDTGRVRVATRTKQRVALVDEDLAREHVEVETVPVGRRIDAVPAVRRDGATTIFPVVEEVLHVERQLILKEEVHIRRVRTSERHQEKVTLRHQEAVVTRAPVDPQGAETEDATTSGTSSKKPKVAKTRRG